MENGVLAHLEDLVDRVGLAEILSALQDICSGKADHIRTNWQDSPAAREWDRAYRVLDRARVRIDECQIQ